MIIVVVTLGGVFALMVVIAVVIDGVGCAAAARAALSLSPSLLLTPIEVQIFVSQTVISECRAVQAPTTS